MKEYKADRLLQQLKRAYADRVVRNGFDDNNLYNDELLKLDELDIQKFDELKGIIGKSKAAQKQNDITVNDQGLTNEEYEEIERIKKKPKVELSEGEKARLEELKQKKKLRNDAVSILRGISIRMPLLIYGADVPYEEEITLDRFIEKVDESSWNEFMPSGVTKEVFNNFKKYYDEDIFIAAGRRIRNIAREAGTLEPTERVKKIASLFSNFKNPDKETVLTPWRVVNMHMSDTLGGYDFWDEKHENTLDEPRFVNQGDITKETLSNTSAQILEINSKTGLYPLYVTYSIYRAKCKYYKDEDLTTNLQRQMWYDIIKNNIFVICKTPMAKQITQRTLAGYSDIKINAHYFDDLVNQLKNKPQQFIDRVLKKNYWKKGEVGTMKFNAVVGNPPYQENISGDSDNASLSKQLFPAFIQNTTELDADYVTLITPSRWFTADAQDKSFIKLRQYVKEHNHFSKIFNYPDNKYLFNGVEIAGGINYYLFDAKYLGDVEFYEFQEGEYSVTTRPLFEPGLDIIISMNELVTILNKVRIFNGFTPMTTITKGRNAFGIVGKSSELKKITKDKPFKDCLEVRCAHEKILYTDIKNVTKNLELAKKWKVFTSKGNGGAGILGDPKPVSIIGKAYIGKPFSICTDSLIPVGEFDNEQEAINLQKYMSTKFFRFMIGILKVSQNVYQFTPIQDFTSNSDIDWSKYISEIDKQLYKKYGLSQEEIEFIESKVKSME